MTRKKIIIACPNGFCAGVRRAIDIIEAALRQLPPPIYCLNEIVHNRQVVDKLKADGVLFVHDMKDVPPGSTLLFSAHGVTPEVRVRAEKLKLKAMDATCPFVTKVHTEVKKYASQDYTIILIGHRNHDEVIGVVGEAPQNVVVVENADEARKVTVSNAARIAVITQTTLSEAETAKVYEELRLRFPALVTPAQTDICYATTNRQKAVRRLAGRVKHILVLGSKSSSNTNRLVEVARAQGALVHLIDSLPDLESVSFSAELEIGITAGASTPDSFIQQAITYLKKHGFETIEELSVATENVRFPLPINLQHTSTGL